ELCQIETMAALLGEPYVEWTVNGRAPVPLGNRSRIFAPQGVYAAAGVDRWLAISVTDDDAWLALAKAIRRPELGARYRSVAERRENHDAIDTILAGWTA